MKNKIITSIVLVATLLAGSSAQAVEKPNLSAQGSSFAGNIITTCSTSYFNASVTYTASGSGTGRQAFLNGLNDFVASDVPYGPTDEKPNNFTYVPVIGGAVAFIYNIPSGYGVKQLNLTASVAAKIFDGRITMWNDPALKALNPGASLPAKTIRVHYRGSSSGTTANMANYFIANGQKNWVSSSGFAEARGSAVTGNFASMPTSVTLVNAVDDTAFSFGYVDLSDAIMARVSFAALKNPIGQFVKPSVIASKAFLAAQTVNADGTVKIDYTKKVKGGYNLSLITYALAYTSNKDAKTQAGVAGFLKYVLSSCAFAQGSKLGYVALSGTVQTKALALVKKIK
jgi:phosphate transport system substrate-binding protein